MAQTMMIASPGKKHRRVDQLLFKALYFQLQICTTLFLTSNSESLSASVNIYSETSYLSATAAASSTQILRYETSSRTVFSAFFESRLSQYFERDSESRASRSKLNETFRGGLTFSQKGLQTFNGFEASFTDSIEHDHKTLQIKPYNLTVFGRTFSPINNKLNLNEIYSEIYFHQVDQNTSGIEIEHSLMHKLGSSFVYGMGSGDIFLEPFLYSHRKSTLSGIQVQAEIRTHIRFRAPIGPLTASVDYARILGKHIAANSQDEFDRNKFTLGYRIMMTIGGEV